MNKNILFLLFSFLVSLDSFSLESKEVIIGGDQWCPYVCDSKGNHGFSVELVREVLKREGFKIKYVNSNFLRLIRNIEEGKWHIVTGTDKNFSPNLLISKEPVAYTRWVFITSKKSKWKYTGPDSLEKLRLGTVAGYTYSKELTEYIERNKDTKKVRLHYSNNPQKSNLNMLLLGRIDVFIEDEAVINYWSKEMKIKTDAFRVAGVDFEAPLYCGLNINDQSLSDKIDRGIKKFTKTEEFQKLLKKYEIKNGELFN